MKGLAYRLREMFIGAIEVWKRTRYRQSVFIYIVGYSTKESGEIVIEEVELANLRIHQRTEKLNKAENIRSIN